MSNLRNKIIRLAYAKPELRKHLIPLVKSRVAQRTWTHKQVVDHIGLGLGSDLSRQLWKRKARIRPKDYGRIQDLWDKSDGDLSKMIGLALRQARLIKDSGKAARRGGAAEQHHEDGVADVISQIFLTRALEIEGEGPIPTIAPIKMFVPERDVAKPKKPSWTPPSIPRGIVPQSVFDWQMYDIPGASTAAKSLAKIMQNALAALGRNVTPHNTDKANAKAVSKLLDKMDRARDARDDYGAGDSEPRAVVLDTFERYLKSYLDPYDFPNTFDEINYR